MELPTYTSIWRIEKRLYKLYDFRLPMPLPVGQIAVFTAITVPYVILLTLFGLPFSHTLFWLYVLPPGVLTWLATRPVLESKRLPELIISQVRYIGEPSAWCRMTPHVEKDEMIVTGRVWRRGEPQPAVEAPALPSRPTVPAVEPAAVPAVARPGERARRRPALAAEPGQVRVPAAERPGRDAGAALGAGKPERVRAAGAARGDTNGHGGSNGHGSAPAAFGASGRSAPPAPTPGQAPAPTVPPVAPGAPGAPAPAVPASAGPAAPASAPAPASTPAGTSAPASASRSGSGQSCGTGQCPRTGQHKGFCGAPPSGSALAPADSLASVVRRHRPVLRRRPVPPYRPAQRLLPALRHPAVLRPPPTLWHPPAPRLRPVPQHPPAPLHRLVPRFLPRSAIRQCSGPR